MKTCLLNWRGKKTSFCIILFLTFLSRQLSSFFLSNHLVNLMDKDRRRMDLFKSFFLFSPDSLLPFFTILLFSSLNIFLFLSLFLSSRVGDFLHGRITISTSWCRFLTILSIQYSHPSFSSPNHHFPSFFLAESTFSLLCYPLPWFPFPQLREIE